jgi:hypothetical protein
MAQDSTPDFDWVTARGKCTSAEMFATLSVLAKRDVERINSLNTGARLKWEYVPQDGYFWVATQYGGNITAGVSFLSREGEIVVEDRNHKPLLTAKPILNNQGECRLLVDKDELQPWQLLDRVLGPLFFNRGPATG